MELKMTKRTWPTLISGQKKLKIIGENIKLARLRRNLTMEEVAERAGVSSKTLREIERGSDAVKIGSYINVIIILQLGATLEKVAADDVFGNSLIDGQLLAAGRVSRNIRRTKKS